MQRTLEGALAGALREGGFQCAMVCTEQGLVVAEAGEGATEDVAALGALFDEVFRRARAYLGMALVDEVTVRDQRRGRLVIRPIGGEMEPRMFLAIQLPNGRSWRRITGQLCQRLEKELSGLTRGGEP